MTMETTTLVPSAPTGAVMDDFFRQLAARDPEALAALCADPVDWYIPGNEAVAPWLGRRRDPRGVAAYARALFAATRPLGASIHHRWIDGEFGIVSGEFASELTATGREFRSPFTADFVVRGGRIVRYRLLEDSQALVEALRV